jgi:glyoxylase-like metal-dependent hydrolase (beta-lactamase superfamily II)
MNLGELELHLVSDGLVWVDPGGPFGLVPRALYRRIVEPNSDNLIPQSLTCMVVRSEGQTIVIDTGLGPKLDARETRNWGLQRPSGGLVEGLRALGIGPEQVDRVICTHLHADHCGGNTAAADGRIVPVFTKATYFVQRMEWADASHPDARTRGTYFADNFAPLVAEGRMQLLHGDTEITRHVQCVVTPGHTRGHQSVLLHSGDWYGLFVSDMATFSVHMARAGWLTAFDVEPLENIVTKQRWQRWALERQAWLFFIHDPVKPVARLVERDGRLEAELVEEAAPIIEPLPTPRPTVESAA